MAFPQEAPAGESFDLVVLSEVAYYWDADDLDRASAWLRGHVVPGGRLILVHYTGETDYPQTGDNAVQILWEALSSDFGVERAERRDRYRLDLWAKR
jgi:SAM-dependent methyltransferase